MKLTPENTIDITWIIASMVLLFGAIEIIKRLTPGMSSLDHTIWIYVLAPLVVSAVLWLRRQWRNAQKIKGELND